MGQLFRSLPNAEEQYDRSRTVSELSKRLSYSERLKICQLTTLHYRRIRGDMIETYKIVTGKYETCVAPSLSKERTLPKVQRNYCYTQPT